MKVLFPYGGKFLALHWWTESSRGHLVLSPNVRALYTVADRVFDRNPWAQIKGIYEIEIVAPSKRLHELALKLQTREQTDRFHSDLVLQMREVSKLGMALPAPFAVCTKYEAQKGRGPSKGEDSDSREYRLKYHDGCRHCSYGIRLIGTSPSDLHKEHYDRWLSVNPGYSVNSTLKRSRAAPASDSERLWFAYADFNHHAAGLDLRKVVYSHMKTWTSPDYLSDRVLFFFRRLRDLDAVPMQDLLSEKKKAWEREETKREEDRRAEFDREHLAKAEATVAFFGGPGKERGG
jgi:hypothetical protein